MPEGRPRDYQLAKVYAAEKEFDGYCLKSVGAVEAFVKRVVRSAVWRRWSPVRSVEVRRISRRRWYAADRDARYRGYVALRGDVSSYPMEVILHELSHIPVPNTCADHGPEFCRTELALVRRFMGPEAEMDLRSLFQKHGVEF